jgi:hypothetical protein
MLYRSRQYLQLVHACALDEFIRDLDPRITYLPFDKTTIDMPATITVTTFDAQSISTRTLATPNALLVTGDALPAASGRLTFEWLVSFGSASAAGFPKSISFVVHPYIQFLLQQQQYQHLALAAARAKLPRTGPYPHSTTHLVHPIIQFMLQQEMESEIGPPIPPPLLITGPHPTPQTVSAPLNFANGLSAPIPLTESTINVQLYRETQPGTSWLVKAVGRPTIDLGVILMNLLIAGEEVLRSLFGLPPVEPYLTWYNLFHSDMPLPYRLGAAVMAVIQRTEEVRLRSLNV